MNWKDKFIISLKLFRYSNFKEQYELTPDIIINTIQNSHFNKEKEWQCGDCSIFATNLYRFLEDKLKNINVVVTIKNNEIDHVFLKINGKYIDSNGEVSKDRFKNAKINTFNSIEEADAFVAQNTPPDSLHTMEFRLYTDIFQEIENLFNELKPN